MAKSPSEYAAEQERKIQRILKDNLPFQRAVKNTVVKQAVRIFIGGQNSSSGNTGQYSTTPMYFNPLYAPNKGLAKFGGELKPEGKTGKTHFANGEPHKTVYLDGGYKELRNRTGRRIDKVNLTFTRDLQSDFTNSPLPNKAEPNKVSVNEYTTSIKREHNQKKREGLEAKYGMIFNLTKPEKDFFFKTLDFNFRKALRDG